MARPSKSSRPTRSTMDLTHRRRSWTKRFTFEATSSCIASLRCRKFEEDVMKKIAWLFVSTMLVIGGSAIAQNQRGGRGGPPQPLDIAGNWTGTWSNFNPAQTTSQPNVVCAKLDAKVAEVNGV